MRAVTEWEQCFNSRASAWRMCFFQAEVRTKHVLRYPGTFATEHLPLLLGALPADQNTHLTRLYTSHTSQAAS